MTKKLAKRFYLAYKLATVSILASTLLFIISSFNIPYLGSAPADPLFPLTALPLLYWFSFFITIGTSITLITFYKGCHKKAYALISLLLLTGYIYVLPKLMFSNLIWTDAYTFVGETLYALRFGYIGWGHATDTPGLSIFAASLSLVTGVDHITIAETLPVFMALLLTPLVYLFARIFCGERGSYFAVIVYLSLSWFGLYFNRLSFSLPLMILSWYSIVKKFKSPKFTWAVIALTAFAATVLSHPASSGTAALTVATLMIMIFLFRSLQRLRSAGKKVSELEFGETNANARRFLPITTVVIVFVIWFAWQHYHFSTIQDIIRQTIIAMNEFSSAPEPASQVVSTISKYTLGYLPVVRLRLFQAIFSVAVGTVLAITFCIIAKSKKNPLILASIFFGTAALIPYVLYAHRWSHTPSIYVSFLAAVLLGWFFFDFKPKKAPLGRIVMPFKVITLVITIVFVALMPLLMYSHMAFVYPRDSTLNTLYFSVRHGRGSAIVLLHSGVHYAKFAGGGNISLTAVGIDVPPVAQDGSLLVKNKKYDVLITSFRVYVKDAFIKQEPSLALQLAMLEGKLSDEFFYEKVYQADDMHKIYMRDKMK